MNDSQNKRAVLVGLFVFIGLAFLIAGIFMVGNLHETFKKKMKIVAFFDDVSRLQTGNNVWFSGVKIGTVSSLSFYGKSQVQVIIKIEVKVKEYIRKDSKVKIGTDGLIGNKILVIYGGSSKSKEVEEGDTLNVGKTVSTEDMTNTLQANNKNLLAITGDLKTISKKLAEGEGTIGKLIVDDALYNNLNTATISLQGASAKAAQLVSSLNAFTSKLNAKGALVNQLVTDTIVFNSIKASVVQLKKITDTATVFITNLNETSSNPNTTIGVLLHDKEAGAHLKQTIKNLESSSKKLDEDLEAAQHNFLLRGFFRKRDKAVRDSTRK